MSASSGPAKGLSSDDLRRAARVVRRNRAFVLTTHREPDGDGLGAEAGFYEALRNRGKRVRIVNNDPLPQQYRFLPHRDAFETYRGEEHDDVIRAADVVVILDASHPDRTGRMEPVLSAHEGMTMAIDHHQVSGWATVDVIDSTCSSAAEVTQTLIEALSLRITPTMAAALYVGMATDTQNFTTANTSPGTHERASRLLRAGADPARTHQHLAAIWEPGRLRLLAAFLSGLELAADGQLAWSVLTAEDMAKHGVDRSRLDGFVNHLLLIASAKAAIMFVEEEDGSYRLSMRARPGLQVDGLAAALGGGGHKLAAGARVPAARGRAMIEMLRRDGEPPPAD